MKRSVAFALLLLAVAGCQEFAGLEEADRASQALLRQGMVADVSCPDTLTIGQVAQCEAVNAQRTRLVFGGYPLVAGGWESRGPQIVSVALDGTVRGESPGAIWILARGTLDSVDSAFLVVPAP